MEGDDDGGGERERPYAVTELAFTGRSMPSKAQCTPTATVESKHSPLLPPKKKAVYSKAIKSESATIKGGLENHGPLPLDAGHCCDEHVFRVHTTWLRPRTFASSMTSSEKRTSA